MTKKTTTRTRRATRIQLGEALREADLTPRQEQVLRMRLGYAEAAEPEFRGQDEPETRTRLAHLEAEALRHVRQPAPVPDEEGEARKRSIVDKLKKI